MAEAKPAKEGAEAAVTYNAEALQLNDELVDMLMLLDYETKFCTKELKPISRTFFAYPASNQAQQFKYFSSLAVFGFAEMNVRADWDEYDDPNTVLTKMVVVLKDNGVQANATPGKLKQGWGDSVCLVLNQLIREVLLRTNFPWGAPTHPDEGLADEAEVDADAEIHSVGEDEMPGGDDEEELMYQEEVLKKDSDEEDNGVMQSNIDPREWLLEVERVAPKLKIQLPNDSKEWRTHLQQTTSWKQVIETQFPGAKAQLDKLSSNLTTALEKIRGKEAWINTQFDHRALDYRTQQEEMAQVQTQHTELNEVVMSLSAELKSVSEELESVKADMEDRSTTVTDTAPIQKMKDAFKRLRADTRQLEVRIGVVGHTLMQAKLRQRPQDDRKQGVYGAGGDGNHSDGYDDDDGPRR